MNIYGSAFININSIREISFPNVIYIGNNAFQNCKGLQKIDLPICIFIDKCAFDGCISLEKIEAPSIKEISSAAFRSISASFLSFPKLEILSEGVVDKFKDFGGTFMNCKKLKKICFSTCKNNSILYVLRMHFFILFGNDEC